MQIPLDFEILPDTDAVDHTEKEVKPNSIPSRVISYMLIAREFGITEGFAVSSCSSTDISPSNAFPQMSVRYVDISERDMSALRVAGYDAVVADVSNYQTGREVDLLIQQNAGARAKLMEEEIRQGGFLVTNNYFGEIDLYDTDNWELVAIADAVSIEGLLNDNGDRKLELTDFQDFLETKNLDAFSVVSSDDEWKEVQNSLLDSASYESVRALYLRLYGEEPENLIAWWRDLIQELSQPATTEVQIQDEEGQIRNILMNLPVSRVINGIRFLCADDTILITQDGERVEGIPSALNSRLPRKTGSIDSIYCFRKK